MSDKEAHKKAERRLYEEFSAGVVEGKKRALEWQAIETAPSDGSTFIAVTARAYSPKATICKYIDGKFLSPSQGEKFVIPGWNQWWPTHWMPLPEPPKV